MDCLCLIFSISLLVVQFSVQIKPLIIVTLYQQLIQKLIDSLRTGDFPDYPTMTDAGIAQMSNLKKEDIVIALMGVTGSGKSTLVSLLSDGPVRIGHELTSCKITSK